LLKYYGLPFWAVGVIASFALPSIPHWAAWLAAALVLLAASRRFAVAGMMLCVLLGAAYGVFRTEAALSAQWPLNGASESVLTVEVADMPRGDGRRGQVAAQAWAEGGTGAELIRPVIGMAGGFDPSMLGISTILQIITVHRQLAITGSAVWGQIVRIRRMDFPLIFSP